MFDSRKSFSDLFPDSPNWLLTALGNLGDAILATTAGAKTNVVFMNPVAKNLTGWTTISQGIELPLTEVLRVLDMDSRQPVLDPATSLRMDGKNQRRFILNSKTGTEYIIEASSSSITNDKQLVVGHVFVFRDITARLKAEQEKISAEVAAREAVENQHRWLEAILDRLPTPLIMVNPTLNKIAFTNQSAKELLATNIDGTLPPERLGHGLFAYELDGTPISSENIPSVRAARGEELKNYEFVLQTPLGRRSILASSNFVASQSGHESIALLHLQDVSKLKTLHDQLSMAVRAGELGFWDYDVVESSVSWNEQLRLHYNFPEGKLQGTLQEAFEKIHPDDRARVHAAIAESQTKKKPYSIEFRVVQDVDRIVWLDCRGETFFNEKDEPKRMTGTSLDITQRKKFQEAMAESEAHFRLMADTLPQIVWTADAAGILNYTNKRWREYSGSNVPSEWSHYVHPDDAARVSSIWQHSIETGEDYDAEFRLRRQSDQSYRWFLVRAIRISSPSSSEAVWFGTCTDVSDQKELQQDLEAAKKQADTANAAKSAFLANMSHEIRTPLGAILGFADLMKQPGIKRAELEGFISVVNRNSHLLLRIIDDILDLSKVEAGKMEIESISFSLPELLSDFYSLMGLRARESGIELRLHADTQLPDRVTSDPVRLRQILMNIVGNAIKFTEKGNVDIGVALQNDELIFRVADTGRGISPEQQLRLFQPFMQADESTTRKFGGTGLGLVLTRRLCELLGGEFFLESSQLGAGSIFVAKIKVATSMASSLLETNQMQFSSDAEQLSSETPLSGTRILLVDDSPDNQALFRIILSRSGADVEVAEDGIQAVDMALHNHYDIVLMDVQMPRMDGHEATRTLRNRGYKAPIVALTAHAMREERDRCLQSGFTDFLSKPLNRETLLDLISRLKQSPPSPRL